MKEYATAFSGVEFYGIYQKGWHEKMIGKTISHYKIIEEIGAGGMGVVYKAQDTKLKRTVALKFLPPELTRDPEAKARFIREAQAASSLQHNNICAIHEINETRPAPGEPGDDQMFICMDYYIGDTLKQKLANGALFVEQAIDIAIQIAQGLARAHEEGIIHRDIKPANIIITDRGEVKILDFGLAKLAGQAQLTKDSSTLGTVAYMSPEQVSGKEVDHCSDIWSLGVVLYEMLTGELPFKGDYEQAVIYAILNEGPQPLNADKKMFSAEIEKLLSRALNKNTQERYINAAELLQELSSIRENIKNSTSQRKLIKTKSTKKKPIYITSAIIFILIVLIASFLFFPASEPEESIKSLAVLPFSNIGNDADTDYLGFSLANQIIGDLTYLKNITVRPSTSIEKYKDQSFDPIEAANELRVNFLLTGRYSLAANKIRSDIELIDVATTELIWKELIEVNFENAFQLQDIVSEKVINGLKIQFSPEERNRMKSNSSQNPIAYEFYLKSLNYSSSQKDNMVAIEMLNRSIELDSSYAPAFYELGHRKERLAQDVIGGPDLNEEAIECHKKALTLNPDYLEPLNTLAMDYTDNGNFEKAFELSRRALKINPNHAYTHFFLSYIYRYGGMLSESKNEAQMAIKLDPANKRFRSIGHLYLYIGNYQKAYDTYELDKGTPWTLTKQSGALIRQKKYKKALECINEVLEQESSGQRTLEVLARKAFLEGEIELGIKYTQQWEQEGTWDAEIWYFIAANYGLLGHSKGCVRVLRKAVKGGFCCYPFFLIDPFLDPVRDDPEFQKVLALAKEKHEVFKKKYFPE
ncbi:MAG: protein kinase [Calditrichia bacterium]|nr:protein kinase [Calditrichia bacterium]